MSSLDLLIDCVPTLRVLVILTFRPEFTPPWIGHPHVTMLTLSRLAPRQRAEMIGHLTGDKALVNAPPPKGGGFGLRLKAGLVRLRRTWRQLT